MDFTEDQKKQLVKWYYEGRSIAKVLDIFKTIYGYERSRKSILRVIQRFQKYGCIRGYRNTCTLKANKIINDEAEQLEIFVCAAAELELSSRCIAIELGVSKSTVSRILIKNGYGQGTFIPETEKESCNVTDVDDQLIMDSKNLFEGEMYWEKKKHIIQWYFGGHTPSDIVQLFRTTYNHDVPSKAWVCYIIQLFEEKGCIRSCIRCTGGLLKPADIIENVELEKVLIATMPKEILKNINDPTSNEEMEVSIKSEEPEYSIEFVSVKSPTNIDEKIPKKKKRKEREK